MAKANGMNKMEAVRQGLSDLGKDAMPKQLQPHIKQKYGIDMSVDHVSTYKSLILRRKAKRKPATPTKDSANGAARAAQAAPKKAASSLSDQVAMLKAVANSIGKEEAKKILDLL
jgi:hypothetical protein